ncbi:MAG: DUF4397 domain-containing protein, partial [Myxococcales bacterium]|nr:DUF4397 domain-containing protein [Myxococcales bacterium]
MMNRARWLGLRITLLSTALASACGSDGSRDLTPDAGGGSANLDGGIGGDVDAALPVDAAAATGGLRIVHAAPVAEALDIYLKDQPTPILIRVGYGQVSDVVRLPAGSHQLDVRVAGEGASTAPRFTSEPVTVTRDGSVTAVAAGLLGSTGAATAFRITALDDNLAAVPAGRARVRVVHDAYSLGPVAVDVGDDGSLELASIDRFAASAAAGIEVTAGASA